MFRSMITLALMLATANAKETCLAGPNSCDPACCESHGGVCETVPGGTYCNFGN